MGLIEFIMSLNSGSPEENQGNFTWGSEEFHMGDEDRFMGDE